MATPIDIRTKRIYDPPDVADGRRVLVGRLWPAPAVLGAQIVALIATCR